MSKTKAIILSLLSVILIVLSLFLFLDMFRTSTPVSVGELPEFTKRYSYEISPTTDAETYVVYVRNTPIHFRAKPQLKENANREKSQLNTEFIETVKDLKIDKILYKYYGYTEISSAYCCVQLAYGLLDNNSINLVERFYLNRFVHAPEGYVETIYDIMDI